MEAGIQVIENAEKIVPEAAASGQREAGEVRGRSGGKKGMKHGTRKEIIDAVRRGFRRREVRSLQLTRVEAQGLVEAVFQEVRELVLAGRKDVRIQEFGTFRKRRRRVAGALIARPAYVAWVSFRPSGKLKAGLEQERQGQTAAEGER